MLYGLPVAAERFPAPSPEIALRGLEEQIGSLILGTDPVAAWAFEQAPGYEEWVRADRHLAVYSAMGEPEPVRVSQLLGPNPLDGQVGYAVATPFRTMAWREGAQVMSVLVEGGRQAGELQAADAAADSLSLLTEHTVVPYDPSQQRIVSYHEEVGGRYVMRRELADLKRQAKIARFGRR